MKIIIFGGAGFIGSYLVNYYLKLKTVSQVLVYDNFSSGKKWHLKDHIKNYRLKIINLDIYNISSFNPKYKFDLAIMLAANPDISKAIRQPSIDFDQGTILTQKILEFIRIKKIPRLLYASGSGVYGDVGNLRLTENYGPMLPISTYGASKLACEALISSYAYMFGIKSSSFRFGNVVGGRQTHGVAYDFILNLRKNSRILNILGDGCQSKPYIYIQDIIKAIECVRLNQKNIYDVFNVAPDDAVSVKEIASIVINSVKNKSSKVQCNYSGEARGWKGDVPIVRLNSKKIKSMGWKPRYNSSEAVKKSVREMLKNINFLEGKY
jgi:UDP-glucose 4-epimerase